MKRRQIAGTPTSRYYIYAGDTLIGEIDDGVPTVAYTWGPDGVASRRTLTGSPNSRFYCYGPQGETRNLTDENQAVTSMYFYEAYGKPKVTVPTEQNPYRYGGKFGYYTDNEIQTLQVGARWYSPHLIRWMSRDPIHYRGGDNLSAYVMGNPVKYVDPSGLDKVRILVETVKGVWKRLFVKSEDAVKLLQRGKNIRFGSKGAAKSAAKDAWGEIKCHQPHGGLSKQPHFQPAKRNGRWGHAYFPDVSSFIPVLIGIADFLEEMVNPIAGGEIGESDEEFEQSD